MQIRTVWIPIIVDSCTYNYVLMSVRLWNFKDGGSQNATFLSKNQHAQRIFFKQSYDELWFVEKCQNRTFKVI